MTKIPLALKITIVFLPALLLIFFLSAHEWWINLPAAVIALLAGILLWALLPEKSGGKINAAVGGNGRIDEEFQRLLANTSGTGNTMVFSARKIMNSTSAIKDTLDEMSSALDGVSEGNVQVVQAVEEVNRRLQTIEAQMSAAVEAGEDLKQQAEQSADAVERGNSSLKGSEQSIAENEAVIQEAKEAAEELATFSKNIYKVVDTIKGFARQTNLLALNAGIEASRAGEAGRGFAVVADEVGKLAGSSAEAAEEIGRLISEADSLMSRVKEKTDQTRASLVQQKEHTGELRTSFEGINSSTQLTNRKVAEIKEANETLYDAVVGIRSATENVFETTQKSAASSEEINATANRQQEAISEISEATTSLTRLIENFKQETDKYGLPKVGYINWTSEIASAHLFKHWYKRDSGNDVVLVEIEGEALKEMYAALASGEFDSTVSCWTPGMHDIFVDEHPGKLDVLGTNLAGARIGLVVPDYVTIDSIEELANHADRFGSAIYAIEKDAGVTRQAEKAAEDYNLEFAISYGDNNSICEALDQAIKNKQWVVVTGWIPESMFDRWALKFLDDPRQSFGGEKHIKTVTRLGLKKDHPRLYRALQRFRWSVEDANSYLALLNKGFDPDKAALKMLEKIDISLV